MGGFISGYLWGFLRLKGGGFGADVPAAIRAVPSPVMGAVALFLFGVIAAPGLRMLIDAQTDLSQSRNLVLVSLILVIGRSRGTFFGNKVVWIKMRFQCRTQMKILFLLY